MQVNDAMVAKAAEVAYLRNRAGDTPWDALSPQHQSEWREKVRPVVTAALAEMWRPVNTPTDLPQDGMYLAANDHKQVAMIEARNGYRIVHNMPGFVEWAPICNIVAFMPLPTPPKRDNP